ncbi:GNAT family N-acetyltransferase [Ferruginibacter sp. HRS2-29]|uniref:GNAT family N-acetyltransferase n=1 Tax=Ferruginibacter sp. HRS2-29 TaxID=2487334 RepID=UPI0020CECCF2|nr:GNAT family N-acetyltransferase [Ferruginibacter sp. HRS2-29]
MKIFAETPRLILREIEMTDDADMFEMDSDPEVHLYIENKPVDSIEKIREVIGMLRSQQQQFGTARWAVVDKKTNEWLGWCGLKYFNQPLNGHINFYELGYRFKKKHWGKGYATEASRAAIDFGFETFDVESIYAITDPKNENSVKVLRKSGFELVEVFDYEGAPTNWLELKKANRPGNFTIIRTESANPDFKKLVAELDADLAIRDGDEHAFYAQYNHVTHIKHVLVMYYKGMAVGCGAIKEFDDSCMEVKRMYVLPAYRGKGIAGLLLAALEAWAKELGYSTCVLETGIRQPEAIALYKKNNYSVIPNYGQYAGVENSVCFKKKL